MQTVLKTQTIAPPVDAILKVENLSHWFGNNKVLYDVDIEIARGQVVALVGPSGCGKSTLFRAILGTHPPKAGSVLVDGKIHKSPSRRVGIVYQNYQLIPFLTAKENVAEGLKLDQTTIPYRMLNFIPYRELRKRHLKQAEEMLDKVGLGDKMDLLPSELSGGQRQRVAIAQALILKPSILLLDEPFGAADEDTREDLQDMILQLYQENLLALKEGKSPAYTILMVTHELREALIVSDRVLGLSQHHFDGKNGATIVYDKPAPIFHPGFDRKLIEFEQQRDELRKAVFDPEIIKHREDHVDFWNSYQAKLSEM